MYILVIFLRTKGYQDRYDENGYSTYNAAHGFSWTRRTTKYSAVWRREACFSCNWYNCGHYSDQFINSNYTTTVAILCELDDEVVEFVREVEARGAHKAKIRLYSTLKNQDAHQIAAEIEKYCLVVIITKRW